MITSKEVRKRFDKHKRKLEEYYGTFEDDNIDCIDTYISQQEKVTELNLLKSRIINEYQRYLVCLDTHDYKLKEVVKNEIFKLLDEKGKLEKELGEMK